MKDVQNLVNSFTLVYNMDWESISIQFERASRVFNYNNYYDRMYYKDDAHTPTRTALCRNFNFVQNAGYVRLGGGYRFGVI